MEYRKAYAAVAFGALGLFLTKVPVSVAQNQHSGLLYNSITGIVSSNL